MNKTQRDFRRSNLGDDRYGRRQYEVTHIATGTAIIVTRYEFELPMRSTAWRVDGCRAFEKRFQDCDTLADVEDCLMDVVEDLAAVFAKVR
jgi:hypothetical protein